MHKKCKKCGVEKPLDQFNKTFDKKQNKYYYKSYCKVCYNKICVKWQKNNKERNLENQRKYKLKHPEMNKIAAKKFKASKIDGFHYVYYLPEEHYVGVTNSMFNRMENHKYLRKRYVDNVEIVYKTPNRKEAELVELKLHSLGYEGEHEIRSKNI